MGPVIDSHCHIFPGDFPQRRSELLERDATFAELFSRGQPRFATAESLIEAMDRGGIDRAVAMGVGWNDKGLARESNDCLMESAAAHPGRLSGLCSVNPVWGEAALEEMERCAVGGLIGVGELHPDTQGFALDDPDTLAPLMELAGRLDWPALVHCSEPAGHDYPGKGSTTPGKVYRFIANFPGNRIICAHWGGGLPFYALMPEAQAVFENVYFDTAATPFLYQPAVYRIGASLAGPDKVLFATDFPLIGYPRALGQVEESGLSMADREAILGRNAAWLFGF